MFSDFSEATHVLSHSQRKDPYCSSKSRFRNSKIREVASSACGQATRQAGAKGLIEVSGLSRPVVPVARQPDTRLFFRSVEAGSWNSSLEILVIDITYVKNLAH